MVIIIEHSQISPPAGVPEFSLPLSLFDVPWVYFSPRLYLMLYDFPALSKSHFIDSIVPNLKQSLSITLKHFPPFSGNLIVLTDSTVASSKYQICYVEGDSVSVTFAECSKDFNYLIGNHARKADEFRHLVPDQLPSVVTKAYSSKTIKTFAVQVTLFPDHGFSIGFAIHHAMADASTIFNFLKAWSSIAKFRGDEPFLATGSLPHYNINGLIKDPHFMATRFWDKVGEPKFLEHRPDPIISPTLVRASFIMTEDQIHRLKESASNQLPTITHLSSFTVVCGYVWSCIAKLRILSATDVVEIFICAADFRARLDPPLPPTYFGNCVLPCSTIFSRTSELAGQGGFLKAVELIGEGISKRLKSKNAVSEAMEDWIRGLSSVKIREPAPAMLSISGSPKYTFYDTDFGWGKPKKYEVVSIDSRGLMSLYASNESGCKRAVEIGLCFTKTEMGTFENIFRSGLD